MKKFEKIFKIISIIFIIGCCLFYGGRLIFYYNKLKPAKVNGETVKYVGQIIRMNSGIAYEKDGLYMIDGEYIFKGDVKDNYVLYSDKIWRILKINKDGSVKLVLDNDASVDIYSMNSVLYENSNIYSYLNNDFVTTLVGSDKYLADTTVCSDVVADLSKQTCDVKLEQEKLGLISVNDFTSSVLGEKSFINTAGAIWTINPESDTQMWVAYNGKLAKASISERYGIRPVITLSGSVKIKNGSGTSNDPYTLEV